MKKKIKIPCPELIWIIWNFDIEMYLHFFKVLLVRLAYQYKMYYLLFGTFHQNGMDVLNFLSSFNQLRLRSREIIKREVNQDKNGEKKRQKRVT